MPPHLYRERMLELAGATCHAGVDACYQMVFVENFNVERLAERRIWRRVYLGRYMRQPMDLFDEMGVDEIEQYVRITEELIKAESGKKTIGDQVSRQETDFVG